MKLRKRLQVIHTNVLDMSEGWRNYSEPVCPLCKTECMHDSLSDLQKRARRLGI